MMPHRAVFLERDGILVDRSDFPTGRETLTVHPGIGPGLRRLRRAGFRLVVISNQSGLARGSLGLGALTRTHRHLRSELLRDRVRLDGIFYCPHHRDGIIPSLSFDCTCRSPQPGMLLDAASALGVDLARSWFVGENLDDVEAGRRAGCRTVLVDRGTEPLPAETLHRPDVLVRDPEHALRTIAAVERVEEQRHSPVVGAGMLGTTLEGETTLWPIPLSAW